MTVLVDLESNLIKAEGDVDNLAYLTTMKKDNQITKSDYYKRDENEIANLEKILRRLSKKLL